MRTPSSGPPRITLLTDFGPKDPFIGVMKGVIASIAPEAVVIDLCHGVAPHDVAEGAFLLASSYRFFPAGTIHTAVVDPGVGGDRSVLAIAVGGYTFLVPDNGIAGPVLEREGEPDAAIAVRNEAFFLRPVSRTFHGRDIFAPVAAHLARGVPLERLGPPAQDLARLPFPRVRRAGRVLEGEVIHVDHFGNLITNVPARGGDPVEAVEIAGRRVKGLARCYDDGREGELLALPGSVGYLEIAVRCGRASDALAAGRGTPVRVTLREAKAGGRDAPGGRGHEEQGP